MTWNRRLIAELFRSAPSGRRELWWSVGTGAVAFALLVVRDPTAWRGLWAEDGSIFLSGALNSGFRAFGQIDYGGYFQTIPRIGGALAAALPIDWAAFVVATFAALVTSIGAGYVEYASGSQIQHRWVRVGLALMVVLLPVLRVEAINVMADQYNLVFFCFWLLICAPHGWKGQLVSSIAVVLITFSTLLVTFLIPLALLRLFTDKQRRVVGVVFLISIAANWSILRLMHAHRQLGIPASLSQTVRGYGSEVVNPMMFGGRFSGEFALGHQTVLLSTFALCLFLGTVALSRRDRYRYVAMTVVCISVSLVGYVGETLDSGFDDRYVVFPALMLAAALAVIVDSGMKGSVGFKLRSCALVGIVAFATVISFPIASFRNSGPSWISAVASARRPCVSNREEIEVALMPGGWGSAIIPCDDLGELGSGPPGHTSGSTKSEGIPGASVGAGQAEGAR